MISARKMAFAVHRSALDPVHSDGDNPHRSIEIRERRKLPVATDIAQPNERPPTTRIELAHQLLFRVDLLASLLGNPSIAAEIQVLKRQLARGHSILSARPEDNQFLSVVTLIEAALASLTWKGYTSVVLDALRNAITPALREGAFPFEESEAIRRYFKSVGIATIPCIDLTHSEHDDE